MKYVYITIGVVLLVLFGYSGLYLSTLNKLSVVDVSIESISLDRLSGTAVLYNPGPLSAYIDYMDVSVTLRELNYSLFETRLDGATIRSNNRHSFTFEEDFDLDTTLLGELTKQKKLTARIDADITFRMFGVFRFSANRQFNYDLTSQLRTYTRQLFGSLLGL